MTFKTERTLGLLMALMFIINTATVYAQNNHIIRLLDQESSLPIIGATFTYGDQTGVSNVDGNIEFQYRKGVSMNFSHINYGKWSLIDAEVLQMIEEKVFYRRPIIVNLYPITVIALRKNMSPIENVTLDYQERLAHDGASVLNQNPALNSIRKGGNYGFDPVFRGFKYDQLNVVLNGAQSATAACPNRMDPPTSQMAPNMVDRIEVLKGPHALRYGTGFGATINFVPTKLRFVEENDFYGRISNGFEGNGTVLRNEGQLGFNGKKHDIAVFASWSQGNDYTAGNGQTIAADFNRGSFGTNLGFKLSEDNLLRVSATYNVARDADFPALPMDLREDDTWMFNARHDASFDKDHLSSWNTTVFASFVNHLMDNLLKPLDPRMLNASTKATTYNYGARTEGVWNFEKSNLFAGADFRREGAEGTRVREFLMGPNAGNVVRDNAWQDGQMGKGAVFSEYHLIFDKTRVVLATRLELNRANVDEPTPEFTQANGDTQVTQFNPSFSIGATRNINEEITLGLWLGRAQRSASLTERYINYFPVGQDPYEMLGNPQLDPEVNNQLDLTLNWQNKLTSLDIDFFAGYLQDFISSVIDPELEPRLPMSPGVRRFINIEDALNLGFEFNWVQQLTSGLQHRVGVAYTYAQDLERDEPLPEIAPLDLRYTLSGHYMKGKLLPELTFRHVLEQSRTATEFGETPTPSFSLLDAKLAYNFTKSGRITVGVNNIFDENYYEHLTRSVRGNNQPIFAPGRNAFAAINFVF
ncbi:TonB-dependent receptor domain-containing protein [Flagellimonas lutaonensis]|uniref:Vitamin B12/cobalamin outer membrane transporter n=1 Tax=Flagellimonas lutaonensis TaxID=516051 RepID=A0A0D5YU87_9FLAO|nr:TonB-dependent receptor [Allomuricauda lutaonensis]AKA35451.1 Vitamin B12/cobalamin outer membrane transporter [Allomuricauda lutaonensis]